MALFSDGDAYMEVWKFLSEVLGFRRFSLRGLEKVRGEWNLVCLALNIKRLRTLAACTQNPAWHPVRPFLAQNHPSWPLKLHRSTAVRSFSQTHPPMLSPLPAT